jgi:hypothetical protein
VKAIQKLVGWFDFGLKKKKKKRETRTITKQRKKRKNFLTNQIYF